MNSKTVVQSYRELFCVVEYHIKKSSWSTMQRTDVIEIHSVDLDQKNCRRAGGPQDVPFNLNHVIIQRFVKFSEGLTLSQKTLRLVWYMQVYATPILCREFLF